MTTVVSSTQNTLSIEAIGIIIIITFLLTYVPIVIGASQVFKKCGIPSWKAYVPVYNFYLMFKLVGLGVWFVMAFCASIMCKLADLIGYYKHYSPFCDCSPVNGPIILLIIIQSIINVVVYIIFSLRISKAFHHNKLFAFGVFFLPNIFWLILGFDNSQFNKKYLKKWCR